MNTNLQISIRSQLGSLIYFIEIGVQRGHFAFAVLSKWPSFQKYYGIDPWRMQKNYIDGANIDNNKQEKLYEEVKKRLHKFGEERINLIREFSNKSVKNFEDLSIDLIYLDARHDFCSVLEDLQLYFPKVKCGGIIAGHDFLSVEEHRKFSPSDDFGICADGKRVLKNGGGVKGAVIEFFKQNKNIRIYETNEKWPTWYAFKQC